MIVAADVRFSYRRNPVLQGVELSVRPGQVLGLIGPNGSGKTTLLRTLYASLTPTGGAVLLDGTDLRRVPARQAATELAVVVQEHGGDLPLKVVDMVMLGRAPHLSTFQRASETDHAVVLDALVRVGVAHLAQRPYSGLSGGEKQRVLLARALAQQARHLLLDEPTNHLDVRYQHELLALVRSLAATSGTCAVVVLHDLNLAARYCDELVLLSDGKVAAAGTPDTVLAPAVLEPVYQVQVRRVHVDGELHLLFRPRPHPDGGRPQEVL